MEILIRKNEKWEYFFARMIVVFGIISTLIVPIMEVQDEDTHTMRSINMSYFNFDYRNGFDVFQSVYTFIETYTEGKGIYVFESDPQYRIDHDLYWDTIKIPLNSDKKVFFVDGQPPKLRTYLYGNFAYLPQGIGILIGRFFELPVFYTLILGRLFKLLFYSVMCFWAIRLIPVKKRLLTMLCLMPMPVFFAASLSPDGILVSTCYLFISYCLYRKEKYNSLTLKSGIFLAVLLTFIFSVKMIYSSIILFLLIFIDLKKVYEADKKRFILGLAVLLLIGGGGFIVGYNLIIGTSFENIFIVFYLYFKTYITNIYHYLSLGIANFGTGWSPLNFKYVYLISIYVILAAISKEESESNVVIDKTVRILSLGLFFLISILIFLAGFSMSHIEVATYDSNVGGIQGRYFLAFMPFLFLSISNDRVRFKWIIEDYSVKLVSIMMLIVSNVWILNRYW